MGRKGTFRAARKGTLFDSGAFTIINRDGAYLESPEDFARRAAHWVRRTPRCVGVVSQDYMCEPMVLAKTGLTVVKHQHLTVERYDAILAAWRTMFGAATTYGPNAPPIMPVLQGWTVEDYLIHLAMYGNRLAHGAWVGVGSVCKRQGSAIVIERILTAIKEVRPDLRLHGFWREDYGSKKPSRMPVVVHRRQYGVEFCGSKGGSRCQSCFGGHRVFRQSRSNR